jgi:hypothetical protein
VADFPEAWLWIELEISTEFKPSNELAETEGTGSGRDKEG